MKVYVLRLVCQPALSQVDNRQETKKPKHGRIEGDAEVSRGGRGGGEVGCRPDSIGEGGVGCRYGSLKCQL